MPNCEGTALGKGAATRLGAAQRRMRAVRAWNRIGGGGSELVHLASRTGGDVETDGAAYSTEVTACALSTDVRAPSEGAATALSWGSTQQGVSGAAAACASS